MIQFDESPIDHDGDQVAEEAPQVNHLRDAAIERLDRFWKRGLRLVMQYDGNRLMALSAFCVAMGEIEMTGFRDVVQIAKHFGLKKQTVNKAVDEFQSQLGLPPCAGQRSDEGRKTMKAARERQLNK